MNHDPISELRSALAGSLGIAGSRGGPEISFERPKREGQGDYSTNAALIMAPVAGESPPDLAGRFASALSAELGPEAERIEVAGPGFLNLFLSDRWYRSAVGAILASDRFGGGAQRLPSINLEFVSANPTGPLTAAGGRGAAYGDSLGRILEAAGHTVTREYYLNDTGSQIRAFGASIAARMRNEDVPEDGYGGAYVTELARELSADGMAVGDEGELARAGVMAMRGRIERTLARFGVRFDVWASERALHEQNALDAVLAELREAGETYNADGALWLRTSKWGDDKDRVLVRSDGEPTYFAADIAYHRDKLRRGAQQMIVPLGADHHGYVPRMKAVVGMLTGEPDRYEAPIMQLVNIIEGGERTRMSKRRGEFVTLDELIDDIGADAARFFLLGRSNDTVIDLDLALAREQSQENPSYYIQYAHARIASILRKVREERSLGPDDVTRDIGTTLEVPVAQAERNLIKRLLDLPEQVATAAERRAPHRICAYAQAVAADFHGFYRDCKVVGADLETGVEGTELARFCTCVAAKAVISECLGLVGVSAPEQM